MASPLQLGGSEVVESPPDPTLPLPPVAALPVPPLAPTTTPPLPPRDAPPVPGLPPDEPSDPPVNPRVPEPAESELPQPITTSNAHDEANSERSGSASIPLTLDRGGSHDAGPRNNKR